MKNVICGIFSLALFTIYPIVSAQESFQLTPEFAEEFAEDWVDSWNSHDLQRVLDHYTDDFSMSSLRIINLGFDDSGTLRGKEAVAEYWSPSLDENSRVSFELITILLGPTSITLHYLATRGGRVAAEVFIFDDDGKVRESIAHYDITSL